MRHIAVICLAILAAPFAFADEYKETIDKIFESYTEEGSPGVQVTVMRGEEILHNKGYGLSNLEYDIPVDTETIFHVASVSKQFTAFAVVLLAQDGKLSLDADIREYLPKFPDVGHTITARHLIHHTSGVRDHWSLVMEADWRMDDVITDEDLLKLLYKQRELNFAPGDMHLYSNAGYELLAEIVRSVSGKSLKEFCEERIFGPLGMTHTHFHDDHRHIVPNRAYCYGRIKEGEYEKLVLSYANAGATSLFTTGEDLMKWQRNFVTGKVGGEEAINTMMGRSSLSDGREISYAFGIGHSTYRDKEVIAHSGGDAGFRSYLMRLPELDLSIAVLSNLAQSNAPALGRSVADVFIGEKEAKDAEDAETDNTIDDGEKYEGQFLNLDTNSTCKLSEKDGVLRIVMSNSSPIDLVPLGNHEFAFPGSADTANVKVDMDTTPTAVHITSSNAVEQTYIPVERPRRKDIDLEELTGRYFCPEVDAFMDITHDDKNLIIEKRKAGPSNAVPIFIDGFAWDGETIRFIRNDDGKVVGLRKNSGRILNLWYEKTSD